MASMLGGLGMDMPIVDAVICQDEEGHRILAKYYSKRAFRTPEDQAKFEVELHKKTKHHSPKVEAQVTTFEDSTTVYRLCGDVTFFVVGSTTENELILVHVLDGLVDAVTSLLKFAPEKRNLLSNVELVLLAVDELIDGGIIFETDPTAIEARVMMRGAVPEATSSYSEVTLSSLASQAREAVGRSLFK
mmetsp:Transcript_16393/g.38787  ORF Transcript_16393/g.38787 Transcript_16393/m.38787 type:complete len:189 (+) Transcript_16393:168-734(+)